MDDKKEKCNHEFVAIGVEKIEHEFDTEIISSAVCKKCGKIVESSYFN